MNEPTPPITQLLAQWQAGSDSAKEQLFPLLYGELKRIAGSALRNERPGHTLQATALVNEAYLRLLGQQKSSWSNKSHFMAVAAMLMRRILVDHSRSKGREKRGGQAVHLSLSEEPIGQAPSGIDVLALDHALAQLQVLDEKQAQIVEMRFFAGLTVEECAAVLKLSPRTVKREWRMAKAWLHQKLTVG